ncbi:MAG: hypothetical protein L6Q98_22535 [Anaerolineae bacterium]|nr:hypothetical protein [Anaerolineae bacterium]
MQLINRSKRFSIIPTETVSALDCDMRVLAQAGISQHALVSFALRRAASEIINVFPEYWHVTAVNQRLLYRKALAFL